MKRWPTLTVTVFLNGLFMPREPLHMAHLPSHMISQNIKERNCLVMWERKHAPFSASPRLAAKKVQPIQNVSPRGLVSNIVGAMSGITGPKKSEITNRQLCHFFRADIGLGMAIAQGLGINAEEAMPKQHAPNEAATV